MHRWYGSRISRGRRISSGELGGHARPGDLIL